MIINKSGNPVEFLSPGKADIRSLKVYFSPKQLGEGTPAPDNVRDIVGWDEVDVYNNRLLPKEYQEVEYLYSNVYTANQPYINTQIIPNKNMRVKVSGITGNNVNHAGFIFGSRTTSNSLVGMFWGLTWSSQYYIGFGGYRNASVTPAKTNEEFFFDFNYNDSHYININNIIFQKVTISETNGIYTQPMYLFAINSGGIHDYQVTPVKISKFIVYNHYEDTDPIMNLIPCYRKSDSKPGMWDTVSHTFFTNSGTGEFLVGPDVESNGEVVTCEFPQTFYGGYVDLVSGELVQEWVKYVLDSQATIGYFPWEIKTSSVTGEEYARALFKRNGNLYPRAAMTSAVNQYCNKLPFGAGINSFTFYDGDSYGANINLPTSLIGTTHESLKAYMADKTFDFVYKLRSPITHQLTPQSLQTLINQNIFWTNADRIEIEYDLIESAEMMDIRRRILFNNNPHLGIGTLKYWWSGEDGPVLRSDNKYHWESRVTNLKPELPQSTWIESEKCYLFNDSAYAALNLNDGNFTLGNHWRIVFDMDYMRGSNSGTFIDIGSVTSANKAIGLGISSAGRFNINWKMRGNESNPGCSISMPENLVPIDNQYHRLRGYYEIIDGGDGYDRFQVFVNGIKYICDVQIPQVWYGPIWQRSSGYFGRGITSGYAPKNVKFYDLKIYQID